jgi:alpha-mannosidase II
VQPDEANTNFDVLVNQLTEGHDYLLKNFGVRPRFAWQVPLAAHSVAAARALAG